jgi:hypothetical protein
MILFEKNIRIDDPFPHLYVDNFLPKKIRDLLRKNFSLSNFTTAIGGCPISDITNESSEDLIEWRNSFIISELIPQLDIIFSESINEKYKELLKTNTRVSRLTKPNIGYLHLTKNHVGTTINSHRDDDRASYQFVFFLGDINDGRIETTELISVKDIDQLEKTQDYSALRLLSYGSTNNGFLCFVNQPNSYHCLSKTIKSIRMTIAGSVIHYQT